MFAALSGKEITPIAIPSEAQHMKEAKLTRLMAATKRITEIGLGDAGTIDSFAVSALFMALGFTGF
jgi:hypothetical protein